MTKIGSLGAFGGCCMVWEKEPSLLAVRSPSSATDQLWGPGRIHHPPGLNVWRGPVTSAGLCIHAFST